MTNNDSVHKDKIRNSVLFALSEIRKLKEAPKKETGYTTLLDTTYSIPAESQDSIRYVAPIKRTVCEHLILVHQARNVMSEYLKMKSFILDVYVGNVANQVGLRDAASQSKMRIDIKNEMEENFKNLTNLSARLASEKGSALDKDLAHNELKSLSYDLAHRISLYRPYYQSYLADNNTEAKILYEMN